MSKYYKETVLEIRLSSRAREFESHRLRQGPVCGQCPQQALHFFAFSTLSFEGVFSVCVENGYA